MYKIGSPTKEQNYKINKDQKESNLVVIEQYSTRDLFLHFLENMEAAMEIF